MKFTAAAFFALAFLAAPASALAGADRASEAERAVHGIAKVNDPASQALVAATALADEAFGLTPAMRTLLTAGSQVQAGALNTMVPAALDEDQSLAAIYRKACGADWATAREDLLPLPEKKRVEQIIKACNVSLSDTVKSGYRSRIASGAVLLSALAETDLATHGATTAAERKLAHYIALLALAKDR